MRILVVAGARPNFMKVAPVLSAFRAAGTHEVLLVHTGQHYDAAMSGDFFRELEIPEPDIELKVGSGTHAEQTARVMVAFERVCFERKPDWAVLVGDVNSTVGCALAGKKAGVRIAHVEAGLRSGDMTMPEEINRLCTDAISDLLFTTDSGASRNLLREGIPEERIRLAGNTMIDTLLKHIGHARSLPLPWGLREGEFAVITLHRPSNVDDEGTLSRLVEVIVSIASRVRVAFPVHPRALKNLDRFGLLDRLRAEPGVTLLEPLSYLRFIGLVARSVLVLTDSGGIQEETTVLGIPCLTMRSTTERPVTCELGTNRLVGADPERIWEAVDEVLGRRWPQGRIPELWDGHAAERIVRSF